MGSYHIIFCYVTSQEYWKPITSTVAKYGNTSDSHFIDSFASLLLFLPPQKHTHFLLSSSSLSPSLFYCYLKKKEYFLVIVVCGGTDAHSSEYMLWACILHFVKIYCCGAQRTPGCFRRFACIGKKKDLFTASSFCRQAKGGSLLHWLLVMIHVTPSNGGFWRYFWCFALPCTCMLCCHALRAQPMNKWF